MKVLILTHVEEAFRECFGPDLLDNIVSAAEGYDRVVHMTSHVENDAPVEEIRHVIGSEIEWGWGYKPKMFHNCMVSCGMCGTTSGMQMEWNYPRDCAWLIESLGHLYTWVPPELRTRNWIHRSEVHIGGGFNSECLEDLRAVLDHVGIEYHDEYDLIYS